MSDGNISIFSKDGKEIAVCSSHIDSMSWNEEFISKPELLELSMTISNPGRLSKLFFGTKQEQYMYANIK